MGTVKGSKQMGQSRRSESRSISERFFAPSPEDTEERFLFCEVGMLLLDPFTSSEFSASPAMPERWLNPNPLPSPLNQIFHAPDFISNFFIQKRKALKLKGKFATYQNLTNEELSCTLLDSQNHFLLGNRDPIM